MISAVTMTGRMNTCRKYILVTVAPERLVPPNNALATHPPINGVEFAMLMPIVAAPKASASYGSR